MSTTIKKGPEVLKRIAEELASADCAPAPCSALHGATYKELDDANAALSAENSRLRTALEGWVKYFQRDVPMTGYAAEANAEEFTHCWFETQNALSPNDKITHSREKGSQ